MTESEGKKLHTKRPVATIKIGSTTIELTGMFAAIAVAVLFALLVLLVYLVRVTTDSLLWVSSVLWILFIGYWSAVAGQAGATRSSESQASRQLHQLMMYGALANSFCSSAGIGPSLVA